MGPRSLSIMKSNLMVKPNVDPNPSIGLDPIVYCDTSHRAIALVTHIRFQNMIQEFNL